MDRRQLLQRVALLIGGLASGSLARALESGVDGRGRIAQPVLDAGQRTMVATLAELIIPRTDTPGAIEAGVPHFVELMVSDWFTATERGIFLAGLADLDAWCRQHASLAFAACGAEQQRAALADAERLSLAYVAPAGPPDLFGRRIDEHTPFFTKIKELTVLGYYTSELGARQELAYNPMPMRYDGDHDFADVGRQWSY